MIESNPVQRMNSRNDIRNASPKEKALNENGFPTLVALKENTLQGMNSRNDIRNAPASRSVQPGTTPSRILLPENVPPKIDVVKKYRLNQKMKKETRTR